MFRFATVVSVLACSSTAFAGPYSFSGAKCQDPMYAAALAAQEAFEDGAEEVEVKAGEGDIDVDSKYVEAGYEYAVIITGATATDCDNYAFDARVDWTLTAAVTDPRIENIGLYLDESESTIVELSKEDGAFSADAITETCNDGNVEGPKGAGADWESCTSSVVGFDLEKTDDGLEATSISVDLEGTFFADMYKPNGSDLGFVDVAMDLDATLTPHEDDGIWLASGSASVDAAWVVKGRKKTRSGNVTGSRDF